MRKRVGIIAALLVVLLAACGGDAGGQSARVYATPSSPPTATATLQPVVLPTFAFRLPPRIDAQAAFVYDHNSGTALYSLRGDVPLPMASTTKMMTAVVAILNGDLARSVTVSPEIAGIDGGAISVMCCPRLQVGEAYTIRELLYGLLLPSGADAALLIATAVAGGEAPFVARMNRTATWLGLDHTHFVNVHGLDADEHYATAHDLARLADFAMSLPQFRAVVGVVRYSLAATATHPSITLENTNQLLTTGGDLRVDGVKTGWTGGAGYCIVVDARENGRAVIVVILGDRTPESRFTDGAALLRWAYSLPPPPIA